MSLMALTVVVCSLSYTGRHPAVRHNSGAQPTGLIAREENRKVYPYSVVPGGARTVPEAKSAMRNPAVAAHYADFDLGKLKQIKLSTDLIGYVSYRYGDQIYWTSHKVRLRAGETVFTDGDHIARGRCLNCYSAHRMMPTRTHEPSEKVLDTPTNWPLVAMEVRPFALPDALALPPPPEELTPTVPNVPGAAAFNPGHGGGGWFPIIPIIPPIHRHHPQPPGTPTSPGQPGNPGNPDNPTPPPPPVIATPEPAYTWVLLGGLSLLAAIHSRRSRRNRT